MPMTESPENAILEQWRALQSRQLDWAFRAYDRLLATLSRDAQERFSHKNGQDEPYIAVFGKTQVGKTTLLLDLMGIESRQLRQVSGVLRGGRTAGQSATATVMEYRRSEDERWGLSMQSTPEWFGTDEAMTQRLGRLRNDMEAGTLTATTPCEVHIPVRFFNRGQAWSKCPRMLDLHGDNPASDAVAVHVRKMANAYLPFADLILLVGRIDDLGFLRPDAITLPKIEDWQSMPFKFRIVTTYSYSAQSIRDRILGNPSIDAGDLRRHLAEQIETFGPLNESARAASLYFPLEFGESWNKEEKIHSALHARMEPIKRKLRDELLEQINQAASPLGRLRNTLNMQASIKYIQERKTKEAQGHIEQLKGKCKDLQDDIPFLEANMQSCKDRIEKSGQLLRDAADDRLPQIRFSSPAEAGKKKTEESAACLREKIIHFEHELKSMHMAMESPNRFHRMALTKFQAPSSSRKQAVMDEAFSSIREKLSGFVFDAYWFSDNFKNDHAAVMDAHEKAKQQLTDLLATAWRKAVEDAKTELGQSIEQQKAEWLACEDERDKCARSAQLLENEISSAELELKDIERQAREDMKRCDRFIEFLNEEYLVTLSGQMEDAMTTADDGAALLKLLACEHMKNHYADLMADIQQVECEK